MQRATSIVRRAAVRRDRVTDRVTLDHERRHCRRIVLTSDGGADYLVDLEKASVLEEGDALKLDGGDLVLVVAAAQALLEIRAENPLRLLRVAWHIGNRHTPAEITAEAIYLEDDHVLAEMVRGLGASAATVMRPFRPERGAYHGSGGHGHSHTHDGWDEPSDTSGAA
ncbi:urease accessory protein UreE [Lichenihabitans psoromatis]|uniref:urease accessory protein UreE n=1 Tax=Lichenihabitans psoromatis TaxID=2528642 RepID=UPI0010383A4D|nr:urease accessory protein UreE [Lichenihabitans psoromatis]